MRDPKLPPEQFKTDRIAYSRSIASLADLAALDGALASGDAVRFVSRARLALTLHPRISDLSTPNSLTLQVFNDSEATLLAGITLVHGSESREPGLPDVSFSGGREPLVPGMWNQLRFPRESFGFYGMPVGWSDVRSLEIAFAWEKTHTGPDEIRVSLAGLDGEWREIPRGPRLTAEGLGSLLERDVQGVTRFFDDSQRQASLYFHGQEGVFQSLYGERDPAGDIPPPHQYPHEEAEAILSGSIMGQRLPEPIPWDANPLGVQEWTHFLNLHHFMRELVKALAETGDGRYAQALDHMVAHWIEANPVPLDSNGGAGPAWETLSAAWRLREWLWIVGIAWLHPSFRSETNLGMLSSIWEHARHLMDHQGHPNNWIIVESSALALAGLCFPQFTEATQWVETALKRLRREIRRQFFADGAHFELSPLYHAICLHALLEVKRAAASVGRMLPEEFAAPLEKSAQFLASLCRPDFSWPSLNDSGGAAGDYCALVELAGGMYGREDLVWIGSRGQRGRTPDWTSRAFPDAGIAVMRSHHAADANFLVFRAGPPGATHVHGDALSLDVTALGHPLLVDPGITAYAPGPLTDHYRSASAHNMILIDGHGPERAGLSFLERTRCAGEDFSWSSHPLAFECAQPAGLLRSEVRSSTRSGGGTLPARQGHLCEREMVSDDRLEVAVGVVGGRWGAGASDVVVSRTVIFVKPDYWVVRDVLFGTGLHAIIACWQFFPGLVLEESGNTRIASVDERGSGLELIPLLGSEEAEYDVKTGSLRPPRGWVSLNGSDQPATSCRCTIKADLPVTLLWVVLPYSRRDRSTVRATRDDRENREIRVAISFPGTHEDRFTFTHPSDADAEKRPLLHEWGSLSRKSPYRPGTK